LVTNCIALCVLRRFHQCSGDGLPRCVRSDLVRTKGLKTGRRLQVPCKILRVRGYQLFSPNVAKRRKGGSRFPGGVPSSTSLATMETRGVTRMGSEQPRRGHSPRRRIGWVLLLILLLGLIRAGLRIGWDELRNPAHSPRVAEPVLGWKNASGMPSGWRDSAPKSRWGDVPAIEDHR
jgi:hypothetical protein